MRDIHETAMAAAGREEESLSGSGGPAPVVIASFLLPNMLLLLGDANIATCTSASSPGLAQTARLGPTL
jgi:hypothetical protein